jgi:hypothetical protein
VTSIFKIFKNHFGLGSDEAIDGLKSAGNLLEVKGMEPAIIFYM